MMHSKRIAKTKDRSFLRRLPLSTALALALTAASAAAIDAEVVIVPTVPGSLDGANGADGVGAPGLPGGAGGDATALAASPDPSKAPPKAMSGPVGHGGKAKDDIHAANFHLRPKNTHCV
jgi:hypothetical protein